MSLSFKRLKRRIRNFFWRIIFYKEVNQFETSRKIGFLETLDIVSKHQLSVARFGDGEIGLMFQKSIKFQNSSPELSQSLIEVLNSASPNLIICLPTFLNSPLKHENKFWTNFWCEHWKLFTPYLKRKKIYGETQISRPEFFFQYKSEAIEAWQRIWDNRDVCFVTGQGSRFNTEHQLFDNIKTKQTIFSLSENAYSDIDRLVNEIQHKFSPSFLILCALGPTSTVLAYRLSQAGYQILDIGHLPNSYNRYYENAPPPEQISYLRTSL